MAATPLPNAQVALAGAIATVRRRAALPRLKLPRVSLLAVLMWASLSLVLLFLLLPIAAIFIDISPARLLDSLGEGSSLEALVLSLETSSAAIAIVVAIGTPTAYLLAVRSFRGKATVTTLIELPLGARRPTGRHAGAHRHTLALSALLVAVSLALLLTAKALLRSASHSAT